MKAINNKLKFFLLFITFIFVILSFKQLEGFSTPIILGNLLTSQGEPANLPPTRPSAVNFNILYSSGSLTESTYNSMTGIVEPRSTSNTNTGSTNTGSTNTGSTNTGSTNTGSTNTGEVNASYTKSSQPAFVSNSTIQEIAPPPTTDTTSTITYIAATTVLVGTIGGGIYLLTMLH